MENMLLAHPLVVGVGVVALVAVVVVVVVVSVAVVVAVAVTVAVAVVAVAGRSTNMVRDCADVANVHTRMRYTRHSFTHMRRERVYIIPQTDLSEWGSHGAGKGALVSDVIRRWNR
jgi:hypothetical protein